MRALDVRQALHHVAALRRRAALAQVRGQVLQADLRLAAGEDHRPLEHVAHLPHVARPRRRQQALEHLGGTLGRAPGERRLQVAQEAGDQRQPILARALAHRRQVQRHHAEPVEEVFAEPAGVHVARQIVVRGGDGAHVHRDLPCPPQPPERLGLEDFEQLGLQLGGEVPDLVEEDRSAVRDLEQPLLALLGVGEGALLMAEQLRFEKRRRQSRAIHLDERARGARTQRVHDARDPALPRPALPGEQDGGAVARREQLHLPLQLLHPRRDAERLDPLPQVLARAE